MFKRVCRFDSVAKLPASRGFGAALRKRFRRGLCLRLITTTAIAITININAVTISNAYPLTAKQIDWVLVAYNHFDANLEESQCYVELIWRESSFNPRARNGSHYGLAQMRNVKVKDLSPRNQIRWHLRYLDHRYSGSACQALAHLKREGFH
jgi:hypothetical protein